MDAEHGHEPRRRAIYAGLDDAFLGPQGEASRPLCLCVPGGVPMYLARHGDGRLIKRMPRSGYQHALGCPHYGPVAARQADGLKHPEPVAQHEQSEQASRSDCRAPRPRQDERPAPHSGRIRLLALLHDLWRRADLTRWHPGFAGKRHWGIVRRHLLQAARQIRAPAGAVVNRLYVPEVFNVERADRIRERREARWKWIVRKAGDAPASILVISELKALGSGPRFARAWLKHVPDRPFMLRGEALQQIERRYAGELASWEADRQLHIICIATAVAGANGSETMVDMELMLCSPEWIPLADEHDRHLVSALVEAGMSFTKEVAEAPAGSKLTLAAVLRDPPAPVELFIDRRGGQVHRGTGPVYNAGDRAWIWRAAVEPMPQLLARQPPAPASQVSSNRST